MTSVLRALSWARAAGAGLGAGRTQRRGACCLGAGLAIAGCGLGVVVAVACLGAIVAVVSAGVPAATPACSGCFTATVVPMRCAGLFASQGFGDTPWEHPHTGIDIVCPAGTPVVSIGGGVVHLLQGGAAPCLFPPGKRGGLGMYADVVNGSISVLYGHLDSYAVADGSSVAAGTVIGYEGDTGCATGPHLHLQVDEGDTAVNPCPFLPADYPASHAGSRCWGAAPP